MPIERAQDESRLEHISPSAALRAALILAWLALAGCVGYELIDKVMTIGTRHINVNDLTAALVAVAAGALVLRR